MRYDIQKLDVSHIGQLIVLQQQVVAALEDPAILQPLDEEELRYILEGNGVMIGLFDVDKMIAFRALLEPPIDDEHLAYDISYPHVDKVIYQEISNVHPAYRGQNLQQQMATLIMEYVDTTKHTMMCATVMPFNIASLKDKFAQDMYVAALKLKYGGKLRYVFAKSLVEQEQWQQEDRIIDMAQTAEQQQALREGYLGVAMYQQLDKWYVVYKKRAAKN